MRTKKALLSLFLAPALAWANPSLSEIAEHAKAATMPADSVWIETTQTTSVAGVEVVSSITTVKLGDREKITMESPMFSQVVVKAGEKLRMKDVKTGRVTEIPVGNELDVSKNALGVSLWGNGDYGAPVADGKLWKVESKSNLGDSALSARVLWYDAQAKRIVRFSENRQGAVMEVVMEYCAKCQMPDVPRKFNVTAKQGGADVRMKMEVKLLKRVRSLPANFFDL